MMYRLTLISLYNWFDIIKIKRVQTGLFHDAVTNPAVSVNHSHGFHRYVTIDRHWCFRLQKHTIAYTLRNPSRTRHVSEEGKKHDVF